SIVDYQNHLKFESLPSEEEASAKDPVLKEKRDRWHESLGKDIYVQEAVNILDDLQTKGAKTTVQIKKKDKLVKS
ncbi:MAG TPA: carboxy terminal-processing peptidase, partial [Flavobacterium sp.]|nr:carboxy terminal-processing peptidase [Flavobacterium sp.]